MTPSKRIEDAIRNARVTTSAAADERIMAATEAAMAKAIEQQPAPLHTSGPIRRNIMKSKWTKLATAAVIITAIMLAIHALTGSGTSITIAQVRQAMEKIDWMQIINEGEKKNDGLVETDWYSFASKVHIFVDSEGRMRYSDFKTRRNLDWDPGSKNIYEHPIDERKEFADGVTGPFEMMDRTFRIIQAEHGSETVKELGTYEGRKVEVWTISREAKSGEGRTLTVYFDVDSKLPVAGTYDHTRQDGSMMRESNLEFKYPETGPADIYEVGAPRSAQIKPSPE